MRVIVERAALLRSLGHVHRVVERRNTIPILSNVLMRGEGSVLQLKATDLDIEVTESIPADVSDAGATTVPAHVLYDIVRKLPDGAQVSLETGGEGGQMTIRSGRSRFALGALPEGDFPDLATGEMPHGFEIGAIELKRLIDKTQFAISTEETRYYLNGIYLHVMEVDGEPVLRAVATDGHRLARVEIPAPAGSTGMPGVIVPRKAVAEIQKLLDDGGESVGIDLSPAKIRLRFADGLTLISKLIDGTFPDYQRVIPANKRQAPDRRARQLRQGGGPGLDHLVRAGPRGEARPYGRAPRLSVNNPDAGSATEELDVDYGSGALDIGFNARYLLDITAQLEGDTALFKLADPGSPTLIQDREGASALYVLMPMRV